MAVTHEKVLKTLNDMVLYFNNQMNQQEKNHAVSDLTQEAYSRFIEAATLARIRLIALADKIEHTESQMTDEKAIEVLHKSGWMMAHDAEMTQDSISSIVNRIMLDGKKSISVNIFPWEGENNV